MKTTITMIATTMLAVGLLAGCATSSGHDHSKCAACCKDDCSKCCKDAAACAKCCDKK